MCFSLDGNRSMSRGDDGKLKLRDAGTGRLLRSEDFLQREKPSWDNWERPVFADKRNFPDDIDVMTVQYAESESAVGSLVPVTGVWMMKIGDRARSESSTFMELWRKPDVESGFTRLVSPGGEITCIRYHRETHAVVTAGHDGTIRLWDMEPVFLPSPLEASSNGIMGIGRVTAIDTIPDSLRTLCATREGLIGIWIDDLFYKVNLPGSRGLGDDVRTACFTRGKRPVAVNLECMGSHCTIRRWQYGDNSEFSVSGTSERLDGPIFSVAFHPDGNVAYSSEDGTFQLDSDLKNPRHITSISGEEMLFSPDGRLLAFRAGGEVKVRDMEGITTSFQISPDPPFGMSFHPVSNLLATGDHGGLRLTDPRTGNTVAEVPNAHSTYIHSVRFNSTGTILATGDHYGTIKLWVIDGHTITHLSTLQREEAPVLALAFRSDDQTLVAGGWEGGQLYIWKAHWKTWLKMACRRLLGLDILDTLDVNLKEFIEHHVGLGDGGPSA
jgi:WD40 repeat protein